MAKLVHIILLLALVCGPISVIAASDDDTTTTEIPTTTSTTPKTTESTTTSTSTTTEKPTTTTEKTTTTTEKTTTTTEEPTTTPAPPTPSPTPVPEPKRNHWVVQNGTKFCLLVDMAIQVNFTYHTADLANKTALFDVPQAALTESHCGSNSTNMTVSMPGFQFELRFDLNETTKQYKMKMELDMAVMENQFPGAIAQNLSVHLTYGDAVPQGKSYHCNRQQVLNATTVIDGDEGTLLPATVSMSQVQWQAFHDRENDGYDLAKDCDAIDTPDIVPIAVGCALAGLVVIVLLGYLVGRRRSQNRGGYLSM